MSQYSPYSPPQFPDYAVDPASFRNPLAPARRASILMFIFGGLALLCGLGMTLLGAVLTPQMMSQFPNAGELHAMESQLGMPMRLLLIVWGLFVLVPAILYIVLGFFVRRGGLVSCVLGLVLAGGTSLVALLQIIGLVSQRGDPVALAFGACMVLFSLVLCVLLLMWLIQAVRAAPAAAAMRNQFNAQYWQSYQQQQQYAQGGYGYGPGAGGYQAPAGAPVPMPQQMYQAPYPSSAPQAPPPTSQIPAPNSPQAPSENQPRNPTDPENRDSGNPT